MPTVIDETTGEEVEVVQVEAAATVASINTLASEFPPEAGKLIEQAMAAAAAHAHEGGITDPNAIRELMLKARESVKLGLRTQMRDEQSQRAAQEQ